MPVSVLKPGLLVAIKTAVRGGIAYRRFDIDPDHIDEAGSRVAKWETTRQIDDPVEFELAQTARSKAWSAIASVCSRSQFGMLCPLGREDDLNEAIANARTIAAEHNAKSARTQLDVYVMIGRVAADDVEAARGISAEVRGLIDAMEVGIKTANPDAIREAANKARSLGQMLSPSAANLVSDAIKEARSAAREIVKRVSKAGETAADVVAECSTKRIDAARFAFLDMDDVGVVESEAPAARGLDLEPPAPQESAPLFATPQFEL